MPLNGRGDRGENIKKYIRGFAMEK